MAKRHVYAKDITGYGEFIYVDLLPDVKRARRFNVNVISALLFAIVLAFFLIYLPYRDNTFQLEQVISDNNDLIHELSLTEEEFSGYEIDLSAISFEQDIERMEQLQVNFNNLMDDVSLIVDGRNGRIRTVSYDAESDQITIEVTLIEDWRFGSINDALLNRPWVAASSHSEPVRAGDDIEFTATFTIEVDYNVE